MEGVAQVALQGRAPFRSHRTKLFEVIGGHITNEYVWHACDDINDAIVTASSIAAAMSIPAKRMGYRSAIAGETTAGLAGGGEGRQRRTALEAIAAVQGRRLADISRDLLDEYVTRYAN